MSPAKMAIAVVVLASSLTTSAMGQRLERPERRCPVLAWPDGHTTTLSSYKETERFAEACGSPADKCRLDGKPFHTARNEEGPLNHRRLSDAFVDCMLGPSPIDKGRSTK